MPKAEIQELLCTHCGTRLRDGWYRCPRCREVVTALPTPVPAPATHAAPPAHAAATSSVARPGALITVEPDERPARSRWSVVLGLVAATVLAVIGSFAHELKKYPGPTIVRPLHAAEPVKQARTAPPDERGTAAPRKVDADALVQRVAADATRWGQAALADGDLEQAKAQFEAAIAAGADSADVRNAIGEVLLKQGRLAEALSAFNRAIALDGSRVAFRVNRARARALARQWADAAEDYRVAAQRRPNDYTIQYHLGMALIEVQRYDAASAALERALALAPEAEQSMLLLALGTTYSAAERHDRAREAFERFLTMAPEDVEAPRVRQLLEGLSSTPD